MSEDGRKTALIVDDSASARHVLGRMLGRHGLRVHTAQSAEEAMTYLERQRPDVIFMDHMMPGMDGLEALQAIKARPETATIPVMMYTSQEGSVYVGQARALGAIGVLPKQVQPVEVSRVLRSLNLIATSEAPSAAPEAVDGALRDLLEELFAQQRRLLRDELTLTYAELARRGAPTTSERSAAQDARETTSGARRSYLLWATFVLALAAVAALALWFNGRQQLEAARRAQASLQSSLAQMQRTVASELQAARGSLDNQQALSGAERRRMLDDLQWALNFSGEFGFDEAPFEDRLASLVDGLSRRLADLGYRGAIRLDAHVGRFCLQGDASGWRLADPDTPADQCDQIGWDDATAERVGRQQSVPFANAVAAAARRGLQVRIVSHGTAEPALAYPDPSQGVSAAEWNRIAAANNRVTVNLSDLQR